MMETLGYILVWPSVLLMVIAAVASNDNLGGWALGAFILGIILIWIF